MKSLFTASLFLAIAISVNGQSDVKLEINSKLPSRYTKNVVNRMATAAAQTFPYAELTIKDVDYKIAFDANNRKIKYIVTNDEDFVGSDGLRVGHEITVKVDDIWEYGYFQLRLKPDKNGWQVVLDSNYDSDRTVMDRIRQDGQFKTTIWAFVKGYNY